MYYCINIIVCDIGCRLSGFYYVFLSGSPMFITNLDPIHIDCSEVCVTITCTSSTISLSISTDVEADGGGRVYSSESGVGLVT